jgi:tRNA pseudouridine38-40 synthase
MPYRYFIELQFNGTNFHGWQIQGNSRTVQSEVNEKLSILLKHPIKTVGAGRTDTGVHARYFVTHFDFPENISSDLIPLTRKLNLFLSEDIAILRISPVDIKAHARFDVLSRTYKYYISTLKDVFWKDFSWPIYQQLDIGVMRKATKLLLEYSDYTSFCKLHSNNRNCICKVITAEWSEDEHRYILTITADRFLRNMVRAIVGTLVLVGRKKISVSKFKEIIELKNRSKAGESAPAQGLFLHHIEYPFQF